MTPYRATVRGHSFPSAHMGCMMNPPQLRIPAGTTVEYYATGMYRSPAVFQGQGEVAGKGRGDCYIIRDASDTFFNVPAALVAEVGQLLPSRQAC